MNLKSLLLTPLCLLGLNLSCLSAQEYKIDTGHSAALFKIQHIGLGYTHGRFNDFSGSINFDENDLSKASVNLTIKVASIDSNDKKRDDHLRNADFFDAGTFPEMTFKSTAVAAVADKSDTFSITGDLTIRGKSKSITIEAKKVGQAVHPMTQTPAIGFEATFSIDRTEFDVGVGKVSGFIGKDVGITIGLEAIVPKP